MSGWYRSIRFVSAHAAPQCTADVIKTGYAELIIRKLARWMRWQSYSAELTSQCSEVVGDDRDDVLDGMRCRRVNT